jgi:hypothetical protein
MDGNRYVVMKLSTGEEIVAHSIEENDYELKVLFPMIVRKVPRHGGMAESIVLSPYTYFAADDEYTFQKNQIIFLKELDPKYEQEYNRAIDDFINIASEPMPYNPNELKELTEKLQTMFGNNLIDDEEIDLDPKITVDTSKLIH